MPQISLQKHYEGVGNIIWVSLLKCAFKNCVKLYFLYKEKCISAKKKTPAFYQKFAEVEYVLIPYRMNWYFKPMAKV